MRHLFLPALLVALLAFDETQAQYPPPPGYPPPGYGPSPEQLVDSWYRRFLRRPADPSAGGYIANLRSGMSPEQVLSLILGSAEYYVNIAGANDQSWVQHMYADLAGRPPSPGELQYWLRKLYEHDRNYVSYDLVTRFPQSWQGGGFPPPAYNYTRPFNYYP